MFFPYATPAVVDAGSPRHCWRTMQNRWPDDSASSVARAFAEEQIRLLAWFPASSLRSTFSPLNQFCRLLFGKAGSEGQNSNTLEKKLLDDHEVRRELLMVSSARGFERRRPHS